MAKVKEVLKVGGSSLNDQSSVFRELDAAERLLCKV
jgi:hypothetical protein